MRISDWSSDVCSSDLPAERPDAAAEERADIGRDESGKVERIFDPLVLRHLADVVAVIGRRHPRRLDIEHRAHMHGHRRLGVLRDAPGLAFAPFDPDGDPPAYRPPAVHPPVTTPLLPQPDRSHEAAPGSDKES